MTLLVCALEFVPFMAMTTPNNWHNAPGRMMTHPDCNFSAISSRKFISNELAYPFNVYILQWLITFRHRNQI